MDSTHDLLDVFLCDEATKKVTRQESLGQQTLSFFRLNDSILVVVGGGVLTKQRSLGNKFCIWGGLSVAHVSRGQETFVPWVPFFVYSCYDCVFLACKRRSKKLNSVVCTHLQNMLEANP